MIRRGIYALSDNYLSYRSINNVFQTQKISFSIKQRSSKGNMKSSKKEKSERDVLK
jgi:hypothetical protein